MQTIEGPATRRQRLHTCSRLLAEGKGLESRPSRQVCRLQAASQLEAGANSAIIAPRAPRDHVTLTGPPLSSRPAAVPPIYTHTHASSVDPAARPPLRDIYSPCCRPCPYRTEWSWSVVCLLSLEPGSTWSARDREPQESGAHRLAGSCFVSRRCLCSSPSCQPALGHVLGAQLLPVRPAAVGMGAAGLSRTPCGVPDNTPPSPAGLRCRAPASAAAAAEPLHPVVPRPPRDADLQLAPNHLDAHDDRARA